MPMKKRVLRVPPFTHPKTVAIYRCDECDSIFTTIPFAPGTRPICDRCMSRGNYE